MLYLSLCNIILYTLIIVVLTISFGVSKAICDISESSFSNSKLGKLNPLFWDKHKSWVNKWKNGEPSQGEKFFGSSTFLVWLTDAWHLFNSLSYVSAFALGIFSTIFLNQFYFIIIPFVIGLIIFEYTYRWLKS